MADVVYLYNLVLIPALILLLFYLISRFTKSEKPVLKVVEKTLGFGAGKWNRFGRKIKTDSNLYSDAEFKKLKKEAKDKYNKQSIEYFLVYVVPILLALVSFIGVIDLNIGIPVLIITVVYWAISELAIKLLDIGIVKK